MEFSLPMFFKGHTLLQTSDNTVPETGGPPGTLDDLIRHGSSNMD